MAVSVGEWQKFPFSVGEHIPCVAGSHCAVGGSTDRRRRPPDGGCWLGESGWVGAGGRGGTRWQRRRMGMGRGEGRRRSTKRCSRRTVALRKRIRQRTRRNMKMGGECSSSSSWSAASSPTDIF